MCVCLYARVRSTLRHTATHCDTLLHTATHCDTLLHTATHCYTLLHTPLGTIFTGDGLFVGQTAIHCNTLQHTATNCNILRYQPCSREVSCVPERRVVFAVCCNVFRYVSVFSMAVGCGLYARKDRGSVLQCVAVCCRMLQCVTMCFGMFQRCPCLWEVD